ncbi:MAG: glycosyltransferase [Bacteroidaceae bacterium]|nr:glycosyltransferase [Bacteroidaceae bacterium]
MKKITVIGHFAFGKESCSGQVIKTRVVTEELCRQLTEVEVGMEDTGGAWYTLFRLPWKICRALWNSENVVMMPAYNGIHVITPLLVFFNIFFHRGLHYVVIGGWLTSYARRFVLLRHLLRCFHIYVETKSMMEELRQQHFSDVLVMPNFKNLKIAPLDSLRSATEPPFRLCTFSRVLKEKGIEDAINAVKECNKKAHRTLYTLDIYGIVEQPEWFEAVMQGQPETIRYCGSVAFGDSVKTLNKYFILLFPTFYKGEAFAGTIIDAMASGVPVIASDWHANPELIDVGVTGFLYPTRSVSSLVKLLMEVADEPEKINAMRRTCVERAQEFLPEKAIVPLLSNL